MNVLGGSRVFSFTQTSRLSIILHRLFPLLRYLCCHQGPGDCNTWYERPVMCLPPSVSGFSGPGTELACISVCWIKEWIVVGKGFSQFSPIFHECNFLKTQSVCVLIWRGRDGKELSCPVGSGRGGAARLLITWNLLRIWKMVCFFFPIFWLKIQRPPLPILVSLLLYIHWIQSSIKPFLPHNPYP